MIRKSFVLDLGATKAVVMAGSLDADKGLVVEAFASVACRGLVRGVVADPEEAARAITAAMLRIERDLDGPVDSVAVGLSGPHIQSMNCQGFSPIIPAGRAVRSEDVMQVINHSRQIPTTVDREQVMALPREFRVDGQKGIANPIGMEASRLEVITHVITAQSSAIAALEKAVALAGRRVDQMVVQGLASALALSAPDMMSQGCLIADIGGGAIDLAILTHGSVVYTACIPVGAHHVTSDLSQLLKISIDEAERLKLEHGSANPNSVGPDEVVSVRQEDGSERVLRRRMVAEIIESRMAEIGQMLAKEMEKAGVTGQLAAGVVLTGGGSLLDGAEACLGQALGMKVRSAGPKTVGQNSRKVQGPQFTAAVGLCRSVLQADDQEFEPVSGTESWKDRIRTLKSLFGGRP